MSHNVFVSGTEFTDMAVLKAAVEEIIKETGVPATFHYTEGQQQDMRGWNGRRSKVDAVVTFPNQQYDLGFTFLDGKIVPFFENGARFPGMTAEHTAKSVTEQKREFHQDYHNVGRLQQRYNVIQMERNMRNEGLTARRMTDKATGQIRLEVG